MVMRLRRSWQRDEYARSLAAELDAHIALHAADRIRQGLSPAEALRDARLHLGGVLQTRERCLDVMTFRWMTRWFGGERPEAHAELAFDPHDGGVTQVNVSPRRRGFRRTPAGIAFLRKMKFVVGNKLS